MPVAVITGASRGLGRALAEALTTRAWVVVADARDAVRLRASLGDQPGVVLVPGDVTEPAHRAELVEAVRWDGRRDGPPARSPRPARQQRGPARTLTATEARRLPARRASQGV